MDYDARSNDVSIEVICIVLWEKFAKHRINKHDLAHSKETMGVNLKPVCKK